MSTPYAYFQKQVMPLADAKIGIMTHAFNYGTGVFEGIRGNWNARDETIYLFKVEEHLRRLRMSGKICRVEIAETDEEMASLITQVVQLSNIREDQYIRPLAYKSSEVLGVRVHDLEYLNNRQFTAFRDRRDYFFGGEFAWRIGGRTSAVFRVEQAQFNYEQATLDGAATIGTAATLMLTNEIRHLVVTEGGEVTGVISIRDVLAAILEAAALRLAPVRLRMVHGTSAAEARMFLVELVKGRKGELKVLPPLCVYDEGGGYSAEMAVGSPIRRRSQSACSSSVWKRTSRNRLAIEKMTRNVNCSRTVSDMFARSSTPMTTTETRTTEVRVEDYGSFGVGHVGPPFQRLVVEVDHGVHHRADVERFLAVGVGLGREDVTHRDERRVTTDVGLVAHVDGVPRREIVTMALDGLRGLAVAGVLLMLAFLLPSQFFFGGSGGGPSGDGRHVDDVAVTWDSNHFVKGQDGKTYVPFTVVVDRSKLAAPGVAMYVRAVSKTPAAAATAGTSGERKDDKKKDDRVEYPWDNVHFVEVPDSGKISRALAVPGGEYELFVAVKEKNTGDRKQPPAKAGLLRHDLSIPDFTKTDLATSSVIVADAVEPVQTAMTNEQQQENPYTFGTMKIVPSTEPKFQKSGELQVVFWIYGATQDASKKPDVQIEYNFHQKTPEGEKYFNKTAPQQLNAQTLPPEFESAQVPVSGDLPTIWRRPEDGVLTPVRRPEQIAEHASGASASAFAGKCFHMSQAPRPYPPRNRR